MNDFYMGEENGRKGRVRRAEATEHLFTARPEVSSSLEPHETKAFAKEEAAAYPPNEGGTYEEYVPNDPFAAYDAPFNQQAAGRGEGEPYTPNETDAQMPYVEPEATCANVDENADENIVENASPATSKQYNPYARPASQAHVPDEQITFAPPPKFAMPKYEPYAAPSSGVLPASGEESGKQAMPQVNVYQPKVATWADTARRESLTLRHPSYKVEKEHDQPRKKRRKKRTLRRMAAGACVLFVLGTAAYLGRDWLAQQIAILSGESAETLAGQADMAAIPSQVKGYDAAPPVKLNEKAQAGIAQISGTLPMESFAVTSSNVVTRVQTGENRYDYYLFSSSGGQLLGYFENLPSTGFAVQASDTFYVGQEPYLLNSMGKALLNTSMYAQYVGEHAALSAFENGWAIISDAEGKQFNYINQEGKLLSTLWFARALPFYGDQTVAYVDTGNLGRPEERYTLHVLSSDGEMKRWQYAADMQGVLGAAFGMALLDTGELVSLEDVTQVICQTDRVIAYLDCSAMVVRDQATGKYALFVKGQQHYDFAYDAIAPVPCDMQWMQIENLGFVLCAVTEATYPQPLSHYFALTKDGADELVALSTRSIYPVVLK